MAYTRTNWENNKTQLNATNMNNIEDGIEQALGAIPQITQTTGNSTSEVMSQDGTTKAINSAKTACNTYTNTKVTEALGTVETALAQIDTGTGV